MVGRRLLERMLGVSPALSGGIRSFNPKPAQQNHQKLLEAATGPLTSREAVTVV